MTAIQEVPAVRLRTVALEDENRRLTNENAKLRAEVTALRQALVAQKS